MRSTIFGASHLRRADRGRLPESTDTSRFAIMLPEAEEFQVRAIRALSVEDKLRVAESQHEKAPSAAGTLAAASV